MEDLTLSSVGASFKKWMCCTPILPKALAHFLNFHKKKFKKIEIVCKGSGVSPRPPTGRERVPELQPVHFFKIPPAFLFLRM
jgi:hypothetical protein